MNWFSEKFLELQTAFESYTSPPTPSTEEKVDYTELKVVELKAMAKEKGLKGYTTLRKAQLIEMLQQN